MRFRVRQFASASKRNPFSLQSGALVLFAFVSLNLLSCVGDSGREASSQAAPEIRVGAFLALTGAQASYGHAVREGAELAVEDVNSRGGLLGRKIRLIVEDTQGKPEEAASAVTKLITRDKVIGIIGETASSRSLAAAPICQANRVPMVSPASTNPEVTRKGDFIFRICFIDPYQGAALSTFAAGTLRLRRVAILKDLKSDYSVGLAQFFSESFRKSGGTIVAEQSYAEGDNDFRSQLTAIRSSNAEALLVPGYYTEVGQIAIQARDLGMALPLIGGDGWDSPKLLEIGGKAVEGCFFASERAKDEKFREAFRRKFQREAETLSAQGYDATAVLLAAVRAAGTLDTGMIRDKLAATTRFQGATGEITLGPDRNPIKPVAILEVKNGKAGLREWVTP